MFSCFGGLIVMISKNSNSALPNSILCTLVKAKCPEAKSGKQLKEHHQISWALSIAVCQRRLRERYLNHLFSDFVQPDWLIANLSPGVNPIKAGWFFLLKYFIILVFLYYWIGCESQSKFCFDRYRFCINFFKLECL